MAEANLVVTYDPAHAGKARDEVSAILDGAGVKPQFLESDVEGVFLLNIKTPKEVTKKLNAKANAKKFTHTFHWVPIDKWVSSKIPDMAKAMKEIDAKIKAEESWKMELSKRNYKGETPKLIMQLTENINKKKVDLKNPQKIVKVEIIGKKAGIALLDKSEYLDVPKLKA